MKLEKFKLTCLKCNSDDVALFLDDDGGCNDPGCCSGGEYKWISISCQNCPADEQDL